MMIVDKALWPWEWDHGEQVKVEADDWCVDCGNARNAQANRSCRRDIYGWKKMHRWHSEA